MVGTGACRKARVRTTAIIVGHHTLQRGLRHLHRLTPTDGVITIIGTGTCNRNLLRATQALPSTSTFNMTHLRRTLQLHTKKVAGPMLLLRNFFSTESLPAVSTRRFRATIRGRRRLTTLRRTDLSRPIAI